MKTDSASEQASQSHAGGANAFGRFIDGGRTYEITDWRTPRPWSNVISAERIGLAVSQTGGGFTWIDNSQLAVLTRWQQEFAQDSSGKFLYVRDADTGAVWSLAPTPTWPAYERFACRHGLGWSTFDTQLAGIRAQWTLFVDTRDTAELWLLELENLVDRPRRLELCGAVEWCCGVNPSPRREFHKLFLETAYDSERRAIFAWNHMWEVPSERFGHWNTTFPFVAGLVCTEPVLSAQGDKTAFLGRYGDWRCPVALAQDLWKPRFGRHEDAIGALRTSVALRPRQKVRLGMALVVAPTREGAAALARKFGDAGEYAPALERVRESWRNRLAAHRVETPEPTLDYLANDWLRYQAISARLWGRTGYYQQSGAFGFRDQLQDSQVWLTIDPPRCREQISLHAAHQFADGSVYHWWHPLSEQGHVTRMTDDLLWLAFVTSAYIRETGDCEILLDAAPFLDVPAAAGARGPDRPPFALVEHVWRAFQRVFARTSPRGLPYIGAGDWNDGLSAVGLLERGESIWLAHFLAGLLADWSVIFERATTPGGPLHAQPWRERGAELAQRREALVRAVNQHAWNGRWYIRATLDDGSELGSSANRVGRIFLNAQTWAVLSDVAPPDRAAVCMAAAKEHLVRDMGALLLAPAFDAPIPEVGYITRYAPGLRENGGVYSHAATWAIAAAAKMRDHELVARLLVAINPALKDPEKFWSEPYVMPGNVDGPASPYPGRGGWSWYTGSAQWLHRVICEWVLGVRPEWDGLRIAPCLPPGWARAGMVRPWRGCTYDVRIERGGSDGRSSSAVAATEVMLDGRRLDGDLLPPPARAGVRHEVMVRTR